MTRESYDRYAGAFAGLYFEARGLDADMDAFMGLLPRRPVLLDAGCGPGHQGRYFAARGAMAVGLDSSLPMLREGRRRDPVLRLVAGDLLALPFPPDRFDAVWARASLIHLDDEALATCLAEIRRVLRPRGLFYAAVRRGNGGELRREVKQGVAVARYFRFWQPEEWEETMRRSGFEVFRRGIEPGDPEDWIWTYARHLL